MSQRNLLIENSLHYLGFSDKEARVYIACLELGKGTVSQIARSAEINRTTGYDILNTLAEKGLVHISGKKPKQEFVAESPKKLEKYFKDEIENKKNKLSKSRDLIPELASIHNVKGRPKVTFYEGKDGLQQVYEDTLTSHETILAYANVDEMHKALPYYFPKYYHRRAGKGIHIKAILPDNTEGKNRARLDKREERTSALVPEEYYFSPEINIYDNKVMIASWREKLGIIIESEEIADAMKKIHALAWKTAKKKE